VVTLVHLAMVAAVVVYGAMVALLPPPAGGDARPRAPEWGVLAFGLIQYSTVTAFARRLLRGGRGSAEERTQRYFLLRFAAAEAIGVFGLLLGLTAPGRVWPAVLLLASLFALAVAAPVRDAWRAAFAEACRPAP
jgi:hypothetical protein